MIDTIKIEIALNTGDLKKIFNKAYDKKQRKVGELPIVNTSYNPITLPSWNYVFQLEQKFNGISFELSLPKYLYGQNVFEIKHYEIMPTLEMLRHNLERLYEIKLPAFNKWIVKRLDTCYVLRTRKEEERVQLLEILSACKYKSFKKHTYDTSVMWVGDAYSLKFYLKHEEYIPHDHVRLLEAGKHEYAQYLSEYSKNLVRFEVTHRSGKLRYIFGKSPSVEDIMRYNILGGLFNYLREMAKPDVEIMTNTNVFKRLKSKYSSTKAIKLYQFYKTYNGLSCDRQFILESLDRSTIYRNLRDIKEAGIKIDKPEENSIPQLQQVYDNFLVQVEELGRKSENFSPL